MNVAFVNPDNTGSYRSAQIQSEHLGLCSLAAVLASKGHECLIHDARYFHHSPADLARVIGEQRCAFVGVSLITREAVAWTQAFLRELRQAKLTMHVCVGGFFPTLQLSDAIEDLPDADSFVVGEGEVAIAKLVDALTTGRDWKTIPGVAGRDAGARPQLTGRGELVPDLDCIPEPLRYIANTAGQEFEVLIEGSRGCMSSCSYCAIKPFVDAQGRLCRRVRSPRRIVDELVHLKARNPALRRFRFVDPDFVGGGIEGEKRALEWARLVKDKVRDSEFCVESRVVALRSEHVWQALREAGVVEVYVGIESGSDRLLRIINKNTSVQKNKASLAFLKKMGIDCRYGFMMFTPWTTESDVLANIAFLREVGGVELYKVFHGLDVVPGTPLMNDVVLKPILRARDSHGYFTYEIRDPVVATLRKIVGEVERVHACFTGQLLDLFKRVRQLARSRSRVAEGFDEGISKLYLDMFEFCFQAAKREPRMSSQDARDVAVVCVANFHPNAQKLAVEVEKAFAVP